MTKTTEPKKRNRTPKPLTYDAIIAGVRKLSHPELIQLKLDVTGEIDMRQAEITKQLAILNGETV